MLLTNEHIRNNNLSDEDQHYYQKLLTEVGEVWEKKGEEGGLQQQISREKKTVEGLIDRGSGIRWYFVSILLYHLKYLYINKYMLICILELIFITIYNRILLCFTVSYTMSIMYTQ